MSPLGPRHFNDLLSYTREALDQAVSHVMQVQETLRRRIADRRSWFSRRAAGLEPVRGCVSAPGSGPDAHRMGHRDSAARRAARLWEVHQDTFSGEFEVDFSRGPTHALVFRPRFRVEVAQIGEAEAAFLAAALEGETLETALAAAQSRNASFDPGRSLSEWVESSVIVDFELNGG